MEARSLWVQLPNYPFSYLDRVEQSCPVPPSRTEQGSPQQRSSAAASTCTTAGGSVGGWSSDWRGGKKDTTATSPPVQQRPAGGGAAPAASCSGGRAGPTVEVQRCWPRRELRVRSASIPIQLRLSNSACRYAPRAKLHRRMSPLIPANSRLLSAAAAAPAASPNPSFAVEEYLVDTCGLTPAQVLKASTKLSHLKSSAKSDAVLAFLAGLGLSGADVAELIAKDPQILCAKVEGTLAPNVVGLTGLGLSHTEIGHLVLLAPSSLRKRSIVSNLPYCLSLLGSYENVLQALKRGHYLLSLDLENTVKPTVAYLQECGLGASDIANLFIDEPRVVGTKPERVQVMVACAEGLGVPRGSAMFRKALRAVAFISEEKIAAKVEFLKSMFRWSDAEVRTAVCKAPMLLSTSEDMLQNKSEFLISEVGLEPAYIAHRPVMLLYSLEGRIKPRYYVLKFLKEKGRLHQDRDYYSALMIGEKVFMEKFISPHMEAAPTLAEDYAAACRGEVPTNFRFR